MLHSLCVGEHDLGQTFQKFFWLCKFFKRWKNALKKNYIYIYNIYIISSVIFFSKLAIFMQPKFYPSTLHAMSQAGLDF